MNNVYIYPTNTPMGIRVAVKLSTRLYPLWRRLLAHWRKNLLIAQIESYGARGELHASIHYNHPVRFQGSGALIVEEDVSLGYHLGGSNSTAILLQPRDPGSVIRIGRGTWIMNGSEYIARTSITIGANCRLGPRCVIMDADFHCVAPEQRDMPGVSKPIEIEDNVWFGSEVMVLKGVHIGRDAVVGARCVVTKAVPAGAIVVGNPMRIVGTVYDHYVKSA